MDCYGTEEYANSGAGYTVCLVGNSLFVGITKT